MESHRLKNIDVLKAFAIIAVVLYHSGYMTYGYLGVDVFLVISGYLTTKSLLRRLLGGGDVAGTGYLGFEFDRIVRLLPLLLIAGATCMVLAFWTMLPDDYENLSESVVATNLFGNNVLAAITTKNYWDVVNEYKPLMHTWYVGVLMQFYIFYPILFYLARLDRKNPQRTLLILVSGLAILSLFIYLGTTDISNRFYLLPSRFFEFALGGIVALLWEKGQIHKASMNKWLAYIPYVLLLALLVINKAIIPDASRLVAVVALSAMSLIFCSALENKVMANDVLAKIGAASYSIFVWHQVLLAFYRYTVSSHFTVVGYVSFLAMTAGLSWLTYHFIELKTGKWLKEERTKKVFLAMVIVPYLVLTGFAGYIYKAGGVVRDVPELYITKKEHVDHKAYNDKIYKLDKPFETDKRHWLVVGNSFGRDFANVILESPVSGRVEISYIYIDNYKKLDYAERFSSADKVFLSSLGTDVALVEEMERVCEINGVDASDLIVVGTKNFGESNGQFYTKRRSPRYFEQRTKIASDYIERNDRLKEIYGDRYLDLIGLVMDSDETMPVFTPDHHFVSQDCRHFSKGGAIWFGQLIDWQRYL